MFRYIEKFARKRSSRIYNSRRRQHKRLLATQNMDENLGADSHHKSSTLKVDGCRLPAYIKQIEQWGGRLEINISEMMRYQRKIDQLQTDISELKESQRTMKYGLMAVAQIVTLIILSVITVTVGA